MTTATLSARRSFVDKTKETITGVDYGELAMGLFCTGGAICSFYLVGISWLIGGFMGWVLMFMWGFIGVFNGAAAFTMFKEAFVH